MPLGPTATFKQSTCFPNSWLCLLTGMSLVFWAAPTRDRLNLPKLLRWDKTESCSLTPESVLLTDPLWCVWRCAAGGEKTVRNGLLRDFLGRHHRHRYPGLHVQDAAKRDEGGARQCASGALPRHVRTSAGQHPDCAAGKQLPTRVYRVRIWFQASCGTFSKAASTERALCWWLLVTVVIKLL